jgi:diadenosine tetraphosphate (Ap4A) HIT family hydrolase
MINELSYCPFCKPEFGREIILENELCYCVYDKYPVSKGHALIIPKRHCSDYFELTNEEQSSCWQMVNKLRTVVSEKYNPDGFNIGVNVYESAGQTIPHVHIHLIPRYVGDVTEPEGGVRGVIPNKKEYKIKIDKNVLIKADVNNASKTPQLSNQPLAFLHSKNQILELIKRADDYVETKRLVSKFAKLKKDRVPFYLQMDELDEILHWKLRRQYQRQYNNIIQNTDFLVREVTQTAFKIENDGSFYSIKLKLKTLIKLHGVQIPVASAILTLCFPDMFCVIDFRGYRQFFGNAKKYQNYTFQEYFLYWSLIKKKADELGVTPQEVDMAIWQYDIESQVK